MPNIPERIKFRKKRYDKYSVHNKKNIAKKEADKARLEGHLATVKTFDQKHVVYVKKQKPILSPPIKREVYRTVDGERFDMVTYATKRRDAEQYAKKYKGVLFGNYRIFKEKGKYGKTKGKRRYVIYAKKVKR